MAHKIHNIKSLLNAAKAISEKYYFKIDNHRIEISVSISDENGLKFWIGYYPNNGEMKNSDVFGYGISPEIALDMWERKILEFLNISQPINTGDFNF